MPFTAEELAAMAAFDAEIDAEFEDEATAYRLARENTGYMEEIERAAKADGLTRREEHKRNKIAACKKAYYEANKDEIAAYQKAYREAPLSPRDWLRSFRKEHGYTQRDLAHLLGVTQGTISNWEKGLGLLDPGKLANIIPCEQIPCLN